MSTLRIYLLGELHLERDDVVLSLPTQKAGALLAYLVTYRDRAHPRAVLAGLLWGDMSEERAHHNLADTLWRIQQVIGPGYLLAHRHTLRFNPEADYWLDVNDFVAKAQSPRLADGQAKAKAQNGEPELGVWALGFGHLRDAIALYRGDFLEGFYDDWCLLERERLRALYLSALRLLMAHHKGRGEYEEALQLGRRLLADDPLREEAHREVMRLLALLGRRNEALRQYMVCRRTLAAELGVEPLPETTALYQQIRAAVVAQPMAPAPADFGQVLLVGREGERAAALARLEATIQGHGGGLLIEGEAGVGKTRLVAEVMAGARWRDVAVGQGRSEELEEPPAYGPLVAALRAVLTPLRAAQLRRVVDGVWLREVSTLLPKIAEWLPDLPPHADLPPEPARRRLLEALAQVIQGLGRVSAHLLILEDLHWADAATLDALAYLVPRLRSARVLVLVTARSEELAERPAVRQVLQALDRGGVLDRISLGRLTAAEVTEFTDRALVCPPVGLAERLHQETAGNPLFLVETLTAWRDEGALAPPPGPGGRWTWQVGDRGAGPPNVPTGLSDVPSGLSDVPSGLSDVPSGLSDVPSGLSDVPSGLSDVPSGIRAVIQRRLARVTPPARHALDAAAIIGEEVDFEVLDAVCALSGEACLAALDELARRRLLTQEAACLRFSHDKIRRLVYESLPPTRRRDLHRQVGLVLEARSPDRAERVEALARHFWQGEAWDKAATYLVAAGDRACQVYAHDAALAHYGRVVELGAAAGGQFPEALLRRCQVWELLGQYDRALDDCAHLLRWGQEHDDAVAMSRALAHGGWFHMLRGEMDQGLVHAQQALEIAERAGDSQTLTQALNTAGALRGSRGDFDQALALFHQALTLAQERDDTAEMARQWHNIGSTHLLRGDNDAALAAFDQALARRRVLNNRRDVARTLTNIGHIHYNQGDLAAAQAAFEEAQVIWQELALRADSILARIGLGAVQMRRGHLAEATHTFEEALAIARECGDRQYEVMIQQNLGDIFIAQGRYAEARGTLETARAQAQKYSLSSQLAYVLNRLGHLYLALFAGPQARACYEEAETILGGKGHRHDETLIQWGLGLAWLVPGDTEKARHYLERAVPLAEGSHGVARMLVSNSLAALELAAGAPAQALLRATAAADEAAASGYRESEAEARRWRGEALLALGRPGEAAAALRQALAVADEVGLPAVQWQTLAALGRAYQAQGQLPAARDASTQAAYLVETLAERIGDDELRAGFLAAEPVRRLQQDRDALGRRVHVCLARPDAPTGRPLADDERVVVAWTVDAGDPDAARLAQEGKVALRRARILRLLDEAAAQGGAPTEQDLASALGVTVRTVRSDVAALRQASHHVRTRGG